MKGLIRYFYILQDVNILQRDNPRDSIQSLGYEYGQCYNTLKYSLYSSLIGQFVKFFLLIVNQMLQRLLLLRLVRL